MGLEITSHRIARITDAPLCIFLSTDKIFNKYRCGNGTLQHNVPAELSLQSDTISAHMQNVQVTGEKKHYLWCANAFHAFSCIHIWSCWAQVMHNGILSVILSNLTLHSLAPINHKLKHLVIGVS